MKYQLSEKQYRTILHHGYTSYEVIQYLSKLGADSDTLDSYYEEPHFLITDMHRHLPKKPMLTRPVREKKHEQDKSAADIANIIFDDMAEERQIQIKSLSTYNSWHPVNRLSASSRGIPLEPDKKSPYYYKNWNSVLKLKIQHIPNFMSFTRHIKHWNYDGDQIDQTIFDVFA